MMQALMRLGWAAAIFFLVALHLATPAGFMPSFEQGRILLVSCDGVMAGAPMKMADHGHHSGKAGHQPCPYAAGASPSLPPLDIPSTFEPAKPSAPLLEPSSTSFSTTLHPIRPPSTGPPVPA